MSEVADMARTYQWLNKSSIRANTEALIITSQEQALNTRTVTQKIYHTVQDSRCRLCKQHVKTVALVSSGCSKLAGFKYTERHNNVASIVYRAIHAEYNLAHSEEWCVKPEKSGK